MKILDPYDSNIHLLQKVMDLRSAKQSIIATNIANAETPGYSKKVFSFEDQLQEAIVSTPGRLATTHGKHMSNRPNNIDAVSGKVTEIKDKTGIGDENSVSVDMEMIELSENQLLYETAAQLLKRKFTLLKYMIQEGK